MSALTRPEAENSIGLVDSSMTLGEMRARGPLDAIRKIAALQTQPKTPCGRPDPPQCGAARK